MTIRRKLTSWLSWLPWYRRQSRDADLARELRDHLELEAAEQQEIGLSPEAASNAAHRALGNTLKIEEDVRAAWGFQWLETFAQDIRYGLRMLCKSPGFTTVAILTLALGIGANTAIFSIFNTLFLHPPGVAHPSQVVVLRVRAAKTGINNSNVSAPDFVRIRDNKKIFASAALELTTNSIYSGSEYPLLLRGSTVSSQWFDVFGAKPILGRVFTPDEDQPNANREIVLSYRMWQQWFGGDSGVIGRTIQVSYQPYLVIGIMGRDFVWPNEPNFWLPIGLPPGEFASNNTFNDKFLVVARLQPGVTFAQASSYIDVLSKQFAEPQLRDRAEASQWSLFLMPFTEFVFGDLRSPLFMLIAAVAFVLLIACANIAGLLLARAAGRSKELAVRAALGASRKRLTVQALAENLILGIPGIVAGLILAVWGLQALLLAAPEDLPIEAFPLDANVLVFAAVVGILAVLIFGIAPEWRMSKVNPHNALCDATSSATGSRSRQIFRSWLVVAELAIGLVLLAGTGMLLRSLARINNANPGFNPHGVTTAGLVLPHQLYDTQDRQSAFFHDVLGRLSHMPGISVVGAADPVPFLGGNPSANFEIEGRSLPPGQSGPSANIRIVTGGFFTAFAIPLRRGRLFTDDDRAGSLRVAIIDENLARQYWPDEDPLGKRIHLDSINAWPKLASAIAGPNSSLVTIVGIVGHIRFAQLVGEESSGREGEQSGISSQSASKGAFYLPMYQNQIGWGFLVAKSPSGPSNAESAVLEAIHQVDPNQPCFTNSMDAWISVSLGPQRFAASLVALFAALAILLSAVGLYGLISYNVSQRTHEFGIRIALGSPTAVVFRLVLLQGAKLALIGAAVGLISGIALMHTMRSFLYGVSAEDPMSFVGAGILLVLVALAACYIPARRAMNVDPMIALRYE